MYPISGSRRGVKIVSSAINNNHQRMRSTPADLKGDPLCHLSFTLLNKNGWDTNCKKIEKGFFIAKCFLVDRQSLDLYTNNINLDTVTETVGFGLMLFNPTLGLKIHLVL